MPTRRRDFLRSLGGGLGVVACAAIESQLRAQSPNRRSVGDVDPLNPHATRTPHFAPRAKSVIFLFMVGGPSQIDTYDYKPLLDKLDGKPVPASIRDALNATRHANVFHGCDDVILKSPYAFKPYGQSGMWVSELMPHTFQPTRFGTSNPPIATEANWTPRIWLDSIDRYGPRGPKQPHRSALRIGPTGPVVFATDPRPPYSRVRYPRVRYPRLNRPWAIVPHRSILGRALVWNPTAEFG